MMADKSPIKSGYMRERAVLPILMPTPATILSVEVAPPLRTRNVMMRVTSSEVHISMVYIHQATLDVTPDPLSPPLWPDTINTTFRRDVSHSPTSCMTVVMSRV